MPVDLNRLSEIKAYVDTVIADGKREYIATVAMWPRIRCARVMYCLDQDGDETTTVEISGVAGPARNVNTHIGVAVKRQFGIDVDVICEP